MDADLLPCCIPTKFMLLVIFREGRELGQGKRRAFSFVSNTFNKQDLKHK